MHKKILKNSMKTEALRAMANDLKYNTGLIHSNIQLLIEESFISGVKYGQSNPKIKQLEWDFYGTYYSAKTPVASYLITQEGEFIENYDDCELWVNASLILRGTNESAKAVAQADFEKRIKECLL
jgi:hypothetical protein